MCVACGKRGFAHGGRLGFSQAKTEGRFMGCEQKKLCDSPAAGTECLILRNFSSDLLVVSNTFDARMSFASKVLLTTEKWLRVGREGRRGGKDGTARRTAQREGRRGRAVAVSAPRRWCRGRWRRAASASSRGRSRRARRRRGRRPRRRRQPRASWSPSPRS